MIVRFVGGPWDGREERHDSPPAFLVRFDEDPAAHAEAANIYLYLEAGTAPDGARLFELLGE